MFHLFNAEQDVIKEKNKQQQQKFLLLVK